uniref:Sperm-associated antigen 5 n=1 Tax=Knipowitschia caucasica TaxID=637954 RepID=A0AAV2J7P3_KNICA
MSFSRSEERTPLRCLQTDNVQTSNVKSKSIVSSESVIVALNDALKNVPVGVDAQSSKDHLLYNPEELDIEQATHNPTDRSPNDFATITASSNPDVEMHGSKWGSQVHCSLLPCLSSDATPDGALGLSANVLATEPPRAETLPEVFKAISECTPLQYQKCLTPIVRRASIAFMRARKGLVIDPIIDDGALSGGGSPECPGDDFKLWREHLDSPIPRPLFNSTELVQRSQACVAMEINKDGSPPGARVGEPILDAPGMPDGTLQQQLRQMAEFLMLASGKMGPVSVLPALAPQAEQHNACVGTSPMKMVNHSINTSGQFERKRSFSAVDQCTSTDPLIWNVGCLEGVSRPELEQRVLSSMIIVEALVQQLASAQAHALPSTGAAPSELRERAVQTQHSELSQTSLHRELYLEALNRIKDLEMDGASLQTVIQNIEIVKKNMTTFMSDVDAALGQMKCFGDVARDGHNRLVSDYAQMKSLLVKSRECQMRMIQKVKDSLEQKEEMRTQMEEALAAKDSTESVMGQLRKHCSVEISALEKCVGSQQELLSALHKAQHEQAALNKAYSETLYSTTELLSKTTAQQSSLSNELCRVRALMQRCTPLLLRLNEKAAAAFRDRDQLIAERNQAVQDKEQTDEELSQALQNLQAAKEQNSNFNLQVTILTSEMGVLRQKLSEGEEERAQLDRKATELSATVSSTLASYTFLEQALAVETTSLQQSWADIKQAKDRVQELELSLAQSEQCVGDLSKALSHSEEQLCQLQSVAQTQAQQLQQLQEECTLLQEVREENEFLLSENELNREQVTEIERLLRANLQSLRERNIVCEDLNAKVCQLQHVNKNLQEELSLVRTQLDSSRTEHQEKLEQMVIEIALLHHTVQSMANELRSCLKEENLDQSSLHNIVSSSTVTLAEEREEAPTPDAADAPPGLVFSQCSAFTRITAVTPKRGSPKRSEEEELQTRVTSFLQGLDSTVTELQSTLSTVQQQKDAQLNQQQDTILRLQRELEHAHGTHQTEVSELQFELSRLKARMEKDKVALEQKAQVDKTVSKLLVDMNELQEMLTKLRADNSELRKEVVGLRRSLQQSKAEAQVLHDELRKHTGQSAPDSRDEKIVLLMELEKLKTSLQAEEQARNKLLERAKRHQSIYQTNQQKSEKELQMLSRIINKVRETLLSLPLSVRNCDQLQQLIQYVG